MPVADYKTYCTMLDGARTGRYALSMLHHSRENGVAASRVMLVAGPSPRNPNANHRIELMRLDTPDVAVIR
jgi:hypothetical protein